MYTKNPLFKNCVDIRDFYARMTALPGISEKLKRLDYVIREDFIPAILNRSFSCTDELREILTLPPRFGGLDFPIMAEVADTEYSYSREATNELKEAIVQQQSEYTEDVDKLHEIKMEVTKDRNKRYEDTKKRLLTKLPEQGRLMLELACEKGASSWITALSIKEFGYLLNKQQFTDALFLRYNLTLKDCPKVCACGADSSVNHALICKLGAMFPCVTTGSGTHWQSS